MGKLFKTTKYGSATFDKKSDHHNIIATIIPNIVPNKKPTTVSYTVTPICSNKLFEVKFINVSKILLGLLVMKLSIIPLLAAISHTPKKITKIAICANKIKYCFFLLFFKYLFLSFEIFELFIYSQLLP